MKSRATNVLIFFFSLAVLNINCGSPAGSETKGGTLTGDEVWSGEVTVTETVTVPEGITLTIQPGTVVKFKHYRGYKDPSYVGITVNGGAVTAVGTADQQIWFTSDSDDPINGDWSGISLENTQESRFEYVIVEFGEMGIEQFDSSVEVANSIIRWNNAEGLYAERSTPAFRNNTCYQNGYHDIALEQYNTDVQILNNKFLGGNYAIHHEKSSSRIEGNYFYNYKNEAITAGMESTIVVTGNKFENIGMDPPISVYDGSTSDESNNDYGDGSVSIPVFDYQDLRNYELGYTPGDPEDRYLYIYDTEDDTRRMLSRIGTGLSFGWALVYADGYLWRFSLGSGTVGESLDFIRVDPSIDESYTLYGNDEIMNPRGLTHDGEYFYVNDFSLLKIFKFTVGEGAINIVDSFDIPDSDLGGTMGLTNDGTYLYLKSRDGSKLYKLTKDGTLVGEIALQNTIGNALVWTGDYFWAPGGSNKGMGKFNSNGELVGEIYPAAKDAWALAWDGTYLWTIQRTCENWDDPKIYQIEILDDSLDWENPSLGYHNLLNNN